MDTAARTITLEDKLKVEYCIPGWLKLEQIKSNIAKVKERVQAFEGLRTEPIALVNFGPSLNDTWEKIREYKFAMTCSGAHKFLVDRGIIPTWHLDVDPRAHKIKLMGTPQKETEYLIASTCSPMFIEHLAGYNLRLWHIFDNEEEGYRIVPHGDWMITGGCLHACATVHTEDGLKPIKWIVDNKYSGKVLSLDGQRFIWRKIVGHSDVPNYERKPWVNIGGSSKCTLIVTDDHPCAVIRDPLNPMVTFVKARDLLGLYCVKLPTTGRPPRGNDYPLYNQEQLSVLYGTLMGDSSIAKDGRPCCDHGAFQLEYLKLKCEILGGKITERLHDENEWGGARSTFRWRNGANAQTRYLRDLVYKDGKKSVEFLLSNLNECGLAFWYMDDGCLHASKDSRPMVELNTMGFSQRDHELIQDWFKNKWGLCARVSWKLIRGKRYQLVHFRVDDSEAFFKLVAPYIHQTLHYKLPKHLRPMVDHKFDVKSLGYAARLVKRVHYMDSWCSSKLYDIEVEDTHNFVVKHTVVHNCSAGVRTLTLARFLGFTDLHIFGMDGCLKGGISHASEHPHSPKASYTLEYEGKQYQTTPSMLEAVKNVFHELDMMKDCTATFYGFGLVQAMSKKYQRKEIKKPVYIGFNKPELISAEYRQLNRQLHDQNMAYGVGGGKHAPTVLKLVESLAKHVKFPRVLDYGCGRSYLARELPFAIDEYDPAIPGKDMSPRPADLVVCTDVLEHVEPTRIDFVLDDLRRCTKQIGYFVVHTGPSSKVLADGRNSHVLQQNADWWKSKLGEFFQIAENSFINKPPLIHIVVAPKKMKSLKQTLVAA